MLSRKTVCSCSALLLSLDIFCFGEAKLLPLSRKHQGAEKFCIVLIFQQDLWIVLKVQMNHRKMYYLQSKSIYVSLIAIIVCSLNFVPRVPSPLLSRGEERGP